MPFSDRPPSERAAAGGVSLLEGRDAHDRLADPAFVEACTRVYEQCPWRSPNQHPAFVTAWYACYATQFDPLLVLRESADGQLTGLFTLAVDRCSGLPLVAGMPQVDYVGWVCDAASADAFASDLMALLTQRFAGASLRLRYLARGLPLGWMDAVDGSCGGVIREDFLRPVLALDDPEALRQVLRKRSNKSRYNRLKRMGEVEVLELRGRAALEGWLDDIATFCDLRQGAINDSMPFLEDANKREFHLRLAETEGLLYTTVLMVGGQPAAALVSLCARDSAAVSLFGISPFFAKHSPGKLLVYETGLRLAEAGYRELDLTPGGAWKERFASSSDTVPMVDVYFSARAARMARLRGSASRFVATALRRCGIEPDRLRALVRGLERLSPGAVMRRLGRLGQWVAHTQESRVYRIDAGSVTPPAADALMRVDEPADLLAFTPRETWQSCAAFLADGIERLSLGEHLYSRVEDGLLVHYGWLADRQASSFFPEIGASYEYPAGSAVLYDFYTDPSARGRGYYQRSLRQMIADAAARPGVEHIYISVRAENAPSRHVIEKAGFQYEASLFRRTRFGRPTIREVRAAAEACG